MLPHRAQHSVTVPVKPVKVEPFMMGAEGKPESPFASGQVAWTSEPSVSFDET